MPETMEYERSYENYTTLCSKCGTSLEEDFWPTMPNTCKECHSIYRRNLRHAKRDWMAQYKLDLGCTDCGYNEHPHALEFDHVMGEKEFNVSQGQDKSYKALLEEISKCDVMCANCHRIRTAERGGFYA